MKTALISLTCGILVGYFSYPTFNDISKNLSKIDSKHYDKFEEVRHTNDIISSGISSGTIRLHVRTDSEQSTGVADGKRTHCNIHTADARRIVDITKRADECSARLTALQEWVLEHTR